MGRNEGDDEDSNDSNSDVNNDDGDDPDHNKPSYEDGDDENSRAGDVEGVEMMTQPVSRLRHLDCQGRCSALLIVTYHVCILLLQII